MIEYKQTTIGKIPKDWQVVRLSDICVKITDGTHKTPKYTEKGVPFLSTQNIVPFREGFDFSNYERHISYEEHKELTKRCKPEKDDILISKCGTIGRSKRVDVDYDFSIFVGLALLKIKKDLVDGNYLEQLLNYEPVRHRMEVLSPGSTRKTLTIKAIGKLRVPLPPISEQWKITEILSTVDNIIWWVDDAIAKTERLKKGLLRKLLTEGIGHKDFKETKIGKIPKEWKDTTIEKECVLGTGGTPSRNNSEYFGGNVPWVKSTEVNYNVITQTEETLTESGLKNSNAKIYPSGSLVIALYGQGKTRGKCAIFGIDSAVNQACAVIQSKGRIHIPYLFYWFQNAYSRIRSLSQGANQSNLNMTIIRSLRFPLPLLNEQKRIAEIITSVDSKLMLERKRKRKLERIKKGLMNDLLTGKVRVKVD